MIHPYSAYIILLGNIIYGAWEWLLIFFISFSFYSINNGVWFSASLFLISAVLRALFSRHIARCIEAYSKQQRFAISIICRLFILLNVLLLPLAASYISEFSILLLILLASFSFIIDDYSTLHLKYLWNDLHLISFIKFSSITHIGKRGVIGISPIIALSVGGGNWLSITIVTAACVLIGILTSILTYRRWSNSETTLSHRMPKAISESYDEEITSYLAKWNYSFLFIFNVFFSSTHFLLSRSIIDAKLILSPVFNIVSCFYFGLIGMLIVSIYQEKPLHHFLSFSGVLLSCCVIAITNSLLLLPFMSVLTCLYVVFIGGIAYGYIFIALSKLVTPHFRGPKQASFTAKGESAGRLGMILSFMIVSLLSEYGFHSLPILSFMSLSGIGALLMMHKLSHPPSKRMVANNII